MYTGAVIHPYILLEIADHKAFYTHQELVPSGPQNWRLGWAE